MKTRFRKAMMVSGAMLYLLTAGYYPFYSSSASLTVADKPGSQSSGGSVDPQSDPFPICPQCQSPTTSIR